MEKLEMQLQNLKKERDQIKASQGRNQSHVGQEGLQNLVLSS